MSKKYKTGQFVRIGIHLCRVTKAEAFPCIECIRANGLNWPCKIADMKEVTKCAKLRNCYPKIIRECSSK